MSEALRPKPPKQSAAPDRGGHGGGPDDGDARRPVGPADVSRYIAEICAELTGMASAAKLNMLTYLLGMARQEADRITKAAAAKPD